MTLGWPFRPDWSAQRPNAVQNAGEIENWEPDRCHRRIRHSCRTRHRRLTKSPFHDAELISLRVEHHRVAFRHAGNHAAEGLNPLNLPVPVADRI